VPPLDRESHPITSTTARSPTASSIHSGPRTTAPVASSSGHDERAPSGRSDADTPARRHVGPAGLTPREVEILDLVALGLTNGQIADRLFISRSTAGVHISNILTKTDTHDRHEAARWAHDHGLIRSDDPRRA
jgi:DNA-binding NarL/FixJ family response regulator